MATSTETLQPPTAEANLQANQQQPGHLENGHPVVTGMPYIAIQVPPFPQMEIEEKTPFEEFVDNIMDALGLGDDEEDEDYDDDDDDDEDDGPLRYNIHIINIPILNPVFSNAHEQWQNGHYNGNWQQAIHDVITQLDHIEKTLTNDLSPQKEAIGQVKDSLKQLEEKGINHEVGRSETGIEQKCKQWFHELRHDPKWGWDETQQKDVKEASNPTISEKYIDQWWNKACQEQVQKGIDPYTLPRGEQSSITVDLWNKWQDDKEEMKLDKPNNQPNLSSETGSSSKTVSLLDTKQSSSISITM
jgi:hypothetical protein